MGNLHYKHDTEMNMIGSINIPSQLHNLNHIRSNIHMNKSDDNNSTR